MHHRKPRTRALKAEQEQHKHERAHRRRNALPLARARALLIQPLTRTWNTTEKLATLYTLYDITTTWWPWQ